MKLVSAHFFEIWTSNKAQNLQFLTILLWKCALRHNGVHFFNISTSKSGLELLCFVHVDLKMCFALQRRQLFRHLNFQNWSEHGVLCTFWLGNVLRALTACTFSTAQLRKVLRTWSVFSSPHWRVGFLFLVLHRSFLLLLPLLHSHSNTHSHTLPHSHSLTHTHSNTLSLSHTL